MKLAFCLFKYFPFGGLQRDFLRIALACRDRGHEIGVFVMKWEGDIPDAFKIDLVPVQKLTNHGNCAAFARSLKQKDLDKYDVVVGFNKMPGLDIYFAADSCYQTRFQEARTMFPRFGFRFRTYVSLEKAVFSPVSKTHILILSQKVKRNYVDAYGTPEERFSLLPPGIDLTAFDWRERISVRKQVREEFGLGETFLLLMVGSAFRTKGVDRSIAAVASLPAGLRGKTRLFVIGQGNQRPLIRMAAKLGIESRIRFLGGREDVPRFLLAADLLLHPSRNETYGMTLLEAMAAGLPVLATDNCGFAGHVEKAGAGLLIPSPFVQKTMNQMLAEALFSSEKNRWRENGLAFIAKSDISSLPQKAADIIENFTPLGRAGMKLLSRNTARRIIGLPA
ncbi:MAG: glycosyltransferase family 4 protein [Syntrophotaleaceae bacterium]